MRGTAGAIMACCGGSQGIGAGMAGSAAIGAGMLKGITGCCGMAATGMG
jgi:hypothetical protein